MPKKKPQGILTFQMDGGSKNLMKLLTLQKKFLQQTNLEIPSSYFLYSAISHKTGLTDFQTFL